MKDWKIFTKSDDPHDRLLEIPPPPPWRFPRAQPKLQRPKDLDLQAERSRAASFIPGGEMVVAVNAALHLRRPLLLTGKPGTGKSTLISKVAHQLKLGPVIRWAINSRSTVRAGVYEYDAVGRLQSGIKDPPVESYLTLGPLGTALMAQTWPRALLVDEIDKSDLDFANDLLNVIEEGSADIPELRRMRNRKQTVKVLDWFKETVSVTDGTIEAGQFPFVVMTSNAEREFPPAFLRRCVRLHIKPPDAPQLAEIVNSHLNQHRDVLPREAVDALIQEFDRLRVDNQEVSTDQLLNAVFLTVALRDREERSFSDEDLKSLKANLFRQLSGPNA